MASAWPNKTVNQRVANIAIDISRLVALLECHLNHEQTHGNHATVMALQSALVNYRLLLDSAEMIEKLSVPLTAVSPASRLPR
jgi:uncharacterized membrane-anchored protein